MFGNQVPLHIIFSTKRFAKGTRPTRVNSTAAKCRVKKSRMFSIYIDFGKP